MDLVYDIILASVMSTVKRDIRIDVIKTSRTYFE